MTAHGWQIADPTRLAPQNDSETKRFLRGLAEVGGNPQYEKRKAKTVFQRLFCDKILRGHTRSTQVGKQMWKHQGLRGSPASHCPSSPSHSPQCGWNLTPGEDSDRPGKVQPWLPGGHRALAQPMLHPGPAALTDSRDLPWSSLQHVGQDLPVHPDPALSSLPPSLTCPSTMGTEGGRTPSARHCPMVPTSVSPEGSILLLPGRHLKPSQLQVCVNRQNVPGAFKVGNPTRGPGRPSERKGLAKSTEQLGFPGSWRGLGKGGANGQDYL